ncbi:hypothetical protein CPB85DRAFT_1255672 [Mucidula mucida]|nr:hypothetical protein CPB85DRAFT_1255672 [Mucidula mucida]
MSSSPSHSHTSNFVAGSLGKAHHVRRAPIISMMVHNVYSPTTANTHFASTKPTPGFVSHSRHAPLVHFARKDLKSRSETKHIPSRPPSPYPGKRKQYNTTLSGPAQAREVPVTLAPPKLNTLDVSPR